MGSRTVKVFAGLFLSVLCLLSAGSQVAIAERLPVLNAQAQMINRQAAASVPEPADLADIEKAYQELLAACHYSRHCATAP